jgi:hypothetical protein
MDVKTISSQLIWHSSDGNRAIWEVLLRAKDGKEYKLKTYSRKIAGLGFSGEVVSYVSHRGERFVRQAQKKTATPPYTRDDAGIRAQWAIGQAIALASATMDKANITLPTIESYAKELFATVSRVKGEPITEQDLEHAEGLIRGNLSLGSATA